MRFLSVLCVLVIALCLTASAYAETQSVKVSGDLTMRGIVRDQYDYQGSPNEPTARTGVDSSNQNWFMTNAEVEVDADLTDNVSTVIRLVNQRDWNVYSKSIESTTTLAPNGLGGFAPNGDEFDVMLDLAYVVLKDFIYSPLTLTIGRQDLWFGKGFIVGLNQQNPGAGVTTRTGSLAAVGNLSAPEYTSINSFDAIKAVLDYDPWTITGIYSKIFEGAIQERDDIDLWGVNVGYKFDSYKGEAEAYWFYKADRRPEPWGAIKDNTNDVHTIGLRGSFDPISVVTIAAEGAYQGGEFIGSRLQINNRARSAWALDISGEWRYLADKYSWKPKLGVEYIWYSGNEPEDNPDVAAGAYNGWDGMYRGKFDSAIREFVGKFYASSRYPVRTNYTISTADAAFTNQHQVVFLGSLQPIESLTLKGNYNLFWNQEDYLVTNTKSGGFVGQEVDLQATWDYTEDVSFNVLAAFFVPGEVYYDNRNDTATDLVGSVKVSF